MIQETHQSLAEVCRHQSQTRPDAIAYTYLVDGEQQERTLTYGEFDVAVRAMAARLQALDTRGERALLLYEPGLDFAVGFFACLYAGVIPVPAYPPDPLRLERSMPRLRAIVDDAQASIVMGDEMTLRWANVLLEGLSSVQHVLCNDDVQPDEADHWRPLRSREDDLAFLQYTSGSTGTPKGVMITNKAIMYQVRQITRWDVEDAVGVHWLPTYHDLGLVAGVLLPMYANVPTISMSPFSFVQRPLRWLQAMSRYQATTTGGPNFAFDLCVRKISLDECEGLDLSRWTHALNGGEPIRSHTLRAFVEKFAPLGVRPNVFRPSYGMAETTLGITGNIDTMPRVRTILAREIESKHRAIAVDESDVASQTNESPPARELVSCGPPLAKTDVRIVDPLTCQPCDDGQIGEIWVHSPSAALGYWNRPDETERIFHARIDDSERQPASGYLRTGDLGFLHDTELYITGRLKDLIIISGRNHYPQDIEQTVVDAHESLKIDSGAAFSVEIAEDGGEQKGESQERLVVVQEMQRPKRNDPDLVIEKIREAIMERHQLTPHAIVLIKSGKISKTTSGKIQRRQCRQDYLSGRLSVIAQWSGDDHSTDAGRANRFVEPRSTLEHELAEIWSDVLGVQRISVKDSFFELGGQSIQATLLAARIRDTYHVAVPLGRVFADPTIENLAAIIAELQSNPEQAPTSSHEIDSDLNSDGAVVSLSPSQQQLWTAAQLMGAGGEAGDSAESHNVHAVVELTGELDASLLEHAVEELCRRHDVLRTTFSIVESKPTGLVQLRGAPIQWEDLCHLPSTAQASAVERIASQAIQHHFDLEREPPFRVTVVRQSQQQHTLILAAHHIAVDGWSLGVIASDLSALYQGHALPALQTRFRDYAAWQQNMLAQGEFEEHLGYWEEEFNGFTLREIAANVDRAGRFRGEQFSFDIPPELSQGLANICASSNATPFMGWMTLAQTMVARYSNSADVCVGAPVAGRDHRLADVVGMLVNTLPIRCQLERGTSFQQLLQQVKQKTLEGLTHQAAPFQAIVDRVAPERSEANPLFQFMLVVQNVPHTELLSADSLASSNGHLTAKPGSVGAAGSGLDLTLELRETGGHTTANFQFNAEVFRAETVERMSQHFLELLRAFVDNAKQAASTAPMLAREELQQLRKWNDTDCAAFQNAPFVIEMFEQHAANQPDAIAIATAKQTVSYAELNQQANRLARFLQRNGAGNQATVGVSVPRSIEMIVALLAIQKTGSVYVPLDPKYPRERLDLMKSDCDLAMVLTECHSEPEERAANSVAAFCLSDVMQEIANECADNLQQEIPPHHLAYIIYTSGSTGMPKGVQLEQRGWRNTCLALGDLLKVQPDDRVVQSSSPSFDGSLAEIGMALSHGATLALPDPQADLCRELYDLDVSICFLPPTAWAALSPDKYPRLRTAISVGEACPRALAEKWSQGRQFFNGYGPTEITVSAMLSECDGSEPPPIGPPLPNVKAYVLDDNLQPLPAGVPGELFIGGDGVARGYLNDEALTSLRFLTDPHRTDGKMYRTGDLVRWREDGQLEFLARLDNQVKIRGFRIELGEIESTLLSHEAVQQAAALVHTDNGRAQLTCYVTVKACGAEVDSGMDEVQLVSTLRSHLRAFLPPHCLPHHIHVLDALPATRNGKLDIDALSQKGRRTHGLAAPPRTARESSLVEIWKRALQLEEVGIHDNFFELGGDSILAIQIVAQAQTAGITVTPRQMFQFQTIAELSVAAETTIVTLSEQGELTGAVPLLPIQRWWSRFALATPEMFQQSVWLRLREPLDPARLAVALEHLVKHHDALRMVFRAVDSDDASKSDDSRNSNAWGAEFGASNASNAMLGTSMLHYEDLRGAVDVDGAFAASQQAIASTIRLDEGPMLASGLFETDDGQTLLLTVHHLAVDGVSWRIVLEDLLNIYEQLSRSGVVRLPQKTTSLRQWARHLGQWRRSSEAEAEQAYWADVVSESVPLERAADLSGDNTVGSSETLRMCLPVDVTSHLAEANAAYRTETQHLLLAALAAGYHQTTGLDQLSLHLEHHGREPWSDEIDLSRTVGWLTSCYPVNLPAGAKPANFLREVKETLRAVPQQGLGYGVLQWLEQTDGVTPTTKFDDRASAGQVRTVKPLGDDRASAGQVRTVKPLGVDLVFSFHGDLDLAVHADSPAELIRGGVDLSSAPENQRLATVEVNASISNGQLNLTWTFSRDIHHRKWIESWAESLVHSLEDLITHCLLPESGGASPSDFPMVALSQADLDGLPVSDREVADIWPLLPLQSGMVFRSVTQVNDANLHQATCQIEGELDRAAFEQSWRDVLQRHDALRCSFHWQQLAEPIQVVHRECESPVEWLDWTDSLFDLDTQLGEFLETDRDRGFDWNSPPLLRVTVIQLSTKTWQVVWTHHHVLSDGWSMPLLMKEVLLHYECQQAKQPMLLPSAASARQFIRWQQDQDWGDAEAFWESELSGFRQPTRLAPAAPQDCLPSQEHRVCLHGELTSQLSELAREQKWTINSVVQAAWALALAEREGADDVVFGTTVSGRSAPLANIDGMVGMLINVLPARVQLRRDDTIRSLVQRVHEQQAARSSHEHSPPSVIYRSCVTANGPLFDHLLVFENYPMEAPYDGLPGTLKIRDIQMHEQTSLPLTLMVIPGPVMELRFVFDPGALSQSDVSQLSVAMERMLSELQNPAEKVDDILGHRPLATSGTPDSKQAAPSVETVAPAEPTNETEQLLLSIWEVCLGSTDIGIDDNLFDLGGYSMQALSIVSQARDAGLMIDPQQLYLHPTIRRLAAVAAIGEPAAADSDSGSDLLSVMSQAIVPLRAAEPASGSPPLFLVHPAGGNAFPYLQLAAMLSTDRAVYGVQAHGLISGAAPDRTVESMAKRYATDIASACPEGPYCLAGWSLGGLIAFEAAQQLRAAGHDVEFVGILDIAPRASTSDDAGFAELQDLLPGESLSLAELRAMSDAEQLSYFTRHIQDAGMIQHDAAPEVARRMLDVLRASVHAASRYQPAVGDFPLKLIQAEQTTEGLAESWAEFTTDAIEVQRVPGDHLSMMRPEQVGHVANRLSSMLKDYDTGNVEGSASDVD